MGVGVSLFIVKMEINTLLEMFIGLLLSSCPFISHGSCSPEPHIDVLKKQSFKNNFKVKKKKKKKDCFI